jgi:site-specific recombinase
VRDSILPALDRAAGKAHKVAVLKAVYTWLRRDRREINLSEDPTAGGGLTIPRAEG